MTEFREIDEQEWEQMPPPKPAKPPNRWDALLDAVESGKIVLLDVRDGKLKGTRIGLARSAGTRGFKLAFRYQDGHLAVRKSEQPLSVKPPASSNRSGQPTTTRRARRANATGESSGEATTDGGSKTR